MARVESALMATTLALLLALGAGAAETLLDVPSPAALTAARPVGAACDAGAEAAAGLAPRIPTSS